jgi:hypothetical protein
MDQRSLSEANEEALALWELFGTRAYDAIQRRVALAIDRGQVDDTLFWLEVQARLFGYAGNPLGGLSE